MTTRATRIIGLTTLALTATFLLAGTASAQGYLRQQGEQYVWTNDASVRQPVLSASTPSALSPYALDPCTLYRVTGSTSPPTDALSYFSVLHAQRDWQGHQRVEAARGAMEWGNNLADGIYGAFEAHAQRNQMIRPPVQTYWR